ncbi:MAG: universal stress protein [Halobacteriota archaeon]
MKVLICTDGSSSSLEGIKCILEVLDKKHEYTLLFVLSEEGIYGRYKETFAEDLDRIEKIFGDLGSEQAAAQEIYLGPLRDYMLQTGFRAVPKVREGSVAAEIIAEISEAQYGLTVLSEGKISPMKLLPGSTLHEVLQNTKKCILVVRPPHSE